MNSAEINLRTNRRYVIEQILGDRQLTCKVPAVPARPRWPETTPCPACPGWSKLSHDQHLYMHKGHQCCTTFEVLQVRPASRITALLYLRYSTSELDYPKSRMPAALIGRLDISFRYQSFEAYVQTHAPTSVKSLD